MELKWALTVNVRNCMKTFYSLKVVTQNTVNSLKVYKKFNTESFILSSLVIIIVFSTHFYSPYNYHTWCKYLNCNVKYLRLLPLSSWGAGFFVDIIIMLKKFSCTQGCLAISLIVKTNKLKINMRFRTRCRPTNDPPIFRPPARRPYYIIQRCQ